MDGVFKKIESFENTTKMTMEFSVFVRKFSLNGVGCICFA